MIVTPWKNRMDLTRFLFRFAGGGLGFLDAQIRQMKRPMQFFAALALGFLLLELFQTDAFGFFVDKSDGVFFAGEFSDEHFHFVADVQFDFHKFPQKAEK
jgi:hypothetical protein